MSGLYIHIPYCKQRCIYCDFYSCATREDKKKYIECLIKEFEQKKIELKEQIETIYLGGGTPSTLKKEELSFLFDNILKHKELFKLKEITFEANPENLTLEYLEFLKKNTPINRLSIGIQSFDNQDLKTLGRKHSAEEAIKTVKTTQEFGFDNISIDLMYNLPNMTKEKWLKNLQIAINLKIQHISAYSLTVEEGTMLHTLINKGRLTLPNERQQIEQFDLTIESLTQNGFEHYETSNFALMNKNLNLENENSLSEQEPSIYRSKHNSSYWNNIPYLGIGASAHSFNGGERNWNISDLKEYISRIQNNQPFSEKETLTEKNKYNEYILVGTRIKEGINPNYITSNFPLSYSIYFQKQVQLLLNEYLLIQEKPNSNYKLTLKGLHLANRIALKLFIE